MQSKKAVGKSYLLSGIKRGWNIYICFIAGLFVFTIAYPQCTRQKAEAVLRELMIKEHIPGLAYAVVKDGKTDIMGVMGVASIPYNREVTVHTTFQLASCSKIYCSLLLGKLFDKKLLQPTQTLGELLDSMPDGWKNITVLQLSAHQSGIKMADFSKAANSKQALELAKQMPSEFEPGTKSSYVSSDYWILTYLVEKVTGLSYYAALKKYVLEPLHLKHSFVNNPSIGGITDLDIIPDQAQEYHWFKEDSVHRISQMWFSATGYAAGGIYSSIEDMAKIAQALDTGTFISDQTKLLISKPVMLTNGQAGYFGLGLIVENYQGHLVTGHSGGPALADFIRFEKEKLTIIVLTNNRGVYPYLAKTLATCYIPSLTLPQIPAYW